MKDCWISKSRFQSFVSSRGMPLSCCAGTAADPHPYIPILKPIRKNNHRTITLHYRFCTPFPLNFSVHFLRSLQLGAFVCHKEDSMFRSLTTAHRGALVGLFIFLCVTATLLPAQVTSGTILGTVKD